MTKGALVSFLLTIALNVADPASASSTCTSVLTADQLGELDGMIFPAFPYSAHLSEAVDGDAATGVVKRLTTGEVTKFRGAIAHPFTGPVSTVRSLEDLALKAWLNAVPSAEFPAWNATALENEARRDWVPLAWFHSRSSLESGAVVCRYRFTLTNSLPRGEDRIDVLFAGDDGERIQMKHHGTGRVFTTAAESLSERLLVPVLTGRPR